MNTPTRPQVEPRPFRRPSILEAEAYFRACGGSVIDNPRLEPDGLAYNHPTRTLHRHPDTPPADYLATLIYVGVLASRNEPTVTRAAEHRATIVTYERMIDPAHYWSIYDTHLLDPRARAQALDVPLWLMEVWEQRRNRDHCERLINALRDAGLAEGLSIDEFYRDYYKPTFYAQHLAPKHQDTHSDKTNKTEPNNP